MLIFFMKRSYDKMKIKDKLFRDSENSKKYNSLKINVFVVIMWEAKTIYFLEEKKN